MEETDGKRTLNNGFEELDAGPMVSGAYSLGSRVWRSTLWATDLGFDDPQPGVYSLGPTVWGLESGGPYSGLPTLGLAIHMTVLRKEYIGPFNVNIV